MRNLVTTSCVPARCDLFQTLTDSSAFASYLKLSAVSSAATGRKQMLARKREFTRPRTQRQ